MVSAERLDGMQNVLFHLSRLIAKIGTDLANKEVAKNMAQECGKLANEIKGFAQRLAEQMQQQAGGEASAEMAKTAAKIESDRIMTEAKAANTRESHAQRTAQRQAQFEMEQQAKATAHEQELTQKAQDHAVDLAAQQASAAIELDKAKNQPKPATPK